jgi:hypothetical protein
LSIGPLSGTSGKRLALPVLAAVPLDFAIAQDDQLAAPSLFGTVDALARGDDGIFALAGFLDGLVDREAGLSHVPGRAPVAEW